MQCPRCPEATLDERDRDGVTVDACPRCRGVWLDRGELEKLIARALAEIEEAEGRVGPPQPSAPPAPAVPVDPHRDPRSDPRSLPPHDPRAAYDRRRWDDDDDDDDDDRWKRRHPGQPPHRKSWFHSLKDMID
jgi:Zn-finger nucleic acid-binding protein